MKGIIDLPNYDDNRRVKVIVMPDEEQPELSADELKKVVKSLVGSVPYTDKTLEELRVERLVRKYELAD